MHLLSSTSILLLWTTDDIIALSILALVNVALNRPTAQSSVRSGRGASLAVDGNTSPDGVRDGSCTVTESDRKPWWSVDLGTMVKVTEVAITQSSRFGENTTHLITVSAIGFEFLTEKDIRIFSLFIIISLSTPWFACRQARRQADRHTSTRACTHALTHTHARTHARTQVGW